MEKNPEHDISMFHQRQTEKCQCKNHTSVFKSRKPSISCDVSARSALNCPTTFSSKAFPIVARCADRITKKLEQSNLDEPINVKEYKVLLLLYFMYLLLVGVHYLSIN